MARCESCNKFVSFGDSEFEVNSEDVSFNTARSVSVTFTVEMTRPCGECGQPLRTTSFDVEYEAPVPQGKPDIEEGDELTLDLDDPEETSREDGKGRGKKTFYGFSITGHVQVEPAEDDDPEAEKRENFAFDFETSDDLQASSFDEA